MNSCHFQHYVSWTWLMWMWTENNLREVGLKIKIYKEEQLGQYDLIMNWEKENQGKITQQTTRYKNLKCKKGVLALLKLSLPKLVNGNWNWLKGEN